MVISFGASTNKSKTSEAQRIKIRILSNQTFHFLVLFLYLLMFDAISFNLSVFLSFSPGA